MRSSLTRKNADAPTTTRKGEVAEGEVADPHCQLDGSCNLGHKRSAGGGGWGEVGRLRSATTMMMQRTCSWAGRWWR